LRITLSVALASGTRRSFPTATLSTSLVGFGGQRRAGPSID
jgi:hypothetical protein